MSKKWQDGGWRHALAASLLLLGGLGCGSTSLTNMWKDPSQPRVPLHSFLVVMLRKDATSRRLWEDNFVSALKDRGITATASYTLFPNAPPDTTALAASVRGSGYDAVLTAHQLATTSETRLVPGYRTVQPVNYINPWTGQYYTWVTDVYSPGYIERDRVVNYEVNVWMTRGAGRLIWSGTTASVNPASAEEVNREVAKVIIPELMKSGVMDNAR